MVPFYLMMNKKLVRNELIFLFNFNKHQIKRKKRDCFQSTWQRPWRHCNVLVTGLRPSDSSCSCCFYHQSVEILLFDNFFPLNYNFDDGIDLPMKLSNKTQELLWWKNCRHATSLSCKHLQETDSSELTFHWLAKSVKPDFDIPSELSQKGYCFKLSYS